MTAVEHSPVNRADEGEARDQSGGVPRTPARLDRDRARAVVTGIARGDYDRADDAVDALEACAVPASPQALDRAALIEVLRTAIPPRMTEGYYARVADRVLALVRPVEGVVLTAEEARLAERALREYGAEPYTLDYGDSNAMDALAARLEASA